MSAALTPQASWAAIVFSAYQDQRWFVCAQESLEFKPHPVCSDRSEDQMAASLSRDSSLVAFENGRVEIVAARRDQGSNWVVSTTIQHGVRPTWHAGASNWLFARFVVTAEGEDSDIFEQSGERARLLVKHTGNQDYPHVSNDGTKLVYTSSQIISVRNGPVHAAQQLWMVDLLVAKPMRLDFEADELTEPSWAPSGAEIAVAANKNGQFDIWVVGIGPAGKQRQITSGSGTKTHPTWSPDGKSIMFTMVREGRYSLWIIDVDGRNLRPFEPFGPNSEIQLRDADWR